MRVITTPVSVEMDFQARTARYVDSIFETTPFTPDELFFNQSGFTHPEAINLTRKLIDRFDCPVKMS